MFTIWIDDIHVETIDIDFLLAVAITKILAQQNLDSVITIRENGEIIFKKFILDVKNNCVGMWEYDWTK